MINERVLEAAKVLQIEGIHSKPSEISAANASRCPGAGDGSAQSL